MPRRRRRTHGQKTDTTHEECPRVTLRRDLLPLAALIFLHLAFLWRAVLLRGFFIHSDICYFFEPARAFAHEALRAGRLPLWSPYIFSGYPIAAEGQIAAFYPPSLLISWLLPSPAAVNWLIITHLLLAAVSMHLLARSLGLTALGAWLSAFIFSFSGYLFAHLHHLSLICAAAWLPLTIVFVERAWRGQLLPNACLAAITWAAAALCGHPQTLFLTSLAAFFWITWRLIESARARRPNILRRAASLLAITFILGLGLAAVQLLLTADLAASAPHGERGDLSYITSFSLLPHHLIGLFLPNWQGTPALNTYQGERYYWEYVIYIGLLPLLLACIGAATKRGLPLAALGILALILALAEGNPLYQVLRFLPGFSDFRVPARFIFLFTFAAGLLAGYGWEIIARLARRRVLLYGALIAVLAAFDLLYFDRTLAPLASPEVYRATPAVVQKLDQDPTWGRSLILPPITIYADWLPPGGWARNPDGWIGPRIYLPASVPQSFGLRTIGGYAGFTDPDQARFFQSATVHALQNHDLRLFSLVGVRHLVVGPDINIPGLPAADVPPFTIYTNPYAFPRAFTVSEVIAAETTAEAHLRTIELARRSKLHQTAVITGDLGDFHLGNGPRAVDQSSPTLNIEEPRPEHIIVRADSGRDTLLVLNERWDRGWTARLDGRPTSLLPVDTVLMGAPLPAGEHTVEFVYHPRGLILGRIITLISLTLCTFLVFAVRRRPRERS